MKTESAIRQCNDAEDAVARVLTSLPQYVVGLHSYGSIDDEEVVAALSRCDWTGLWPVIDGDCCLTGEVVDSSSDGYLSRDGNAMIDADVARRAGWRIDYEEGTASPSKPDGVESARRAAADTADDD